MKWTASGDQARSYISAPDDRHICFVRQVSLSSSPSEPKLATWWLSEITQSITLPSSPADASSSPAVGAHEVSEPWAVNHVSVARNIPLGAHRTTFTACVCFDKVDRYSTLRSSPSDSTLQSWTTDQHAGQQRSERKLGIPTRTLLSPPAVAKRPLPSGSKWAE